MCGIYFSLENESALNCEKFLKRGPDFFNEIESNNFIFSHSLLSLTGEFTPQPIGDNQLMLIFNGQIYNYDKSFKSDSYYILNEYTKNPKYFWKNLDGEYAILIFDNQKQEVIFLTDIFGTKPLYYSFKNNSLSVSSLRSTLEINGHVKIEKCKPNTIYKYNLKNKKISKTENYFKFNLDQNHNTFNTWNELFLESVNKRFKNIDHEIILPLSSGHDSGAIACALDKLNIKYYTYSIFRQEHQKVLFKRLIKRFVSSPLETYFRIDIQNKNLRQSIQNYIFQYCDAFFYGKDINNLKIDGRNDPASIGLAYILKKVQEKNSNIKIIASGQGGDEIYSRRQEYTFDQPNPKNFSSNLRDYFPWQNFFYGTQISYLSKEESIGGSFGMETRYPFLDKALVQEYLNLTPRLKNAYYKSPITNFLETNSYPYRKDNRKSGFNP